MKTKDKLKLVERRASRLPTLLYEDYDYSINGDLNWLIEKLKQYQQVLESIACPSKPGLNKQNHWLNVTHEECAETLALDTDLARIALEEE